MGPDVSKCQPFGVGCWLYVQEDRTFDARGEPAIDQPWTTDLFYTCPTALFLLL